MDTQSLYVGISIVKKRFWMVEYASTKKTLIWKGASIN